MGFDTENCEQGRRGPEETARSLQPGSAEAPWSWDERLWGMRRSHHSGFCHLWEVSKNRKAAFSTVHHSCTCQAGSSPVPFSSWIRAGDCSEKPSGKHRPCPNLPGRACIAQQHVLLAAQAKAQASSQDGRRFWEVSISRSFNTWAQIQKEQDTTWK